MPTYDLLCPTCDHEEELFSQIIIMDIKNKCPKCDIVLKKKVGQIITIFKGPGFYATEYGRSQSNNYKEDKKEISERDEFIEQAKKELPS